jgi:hypothetical protein
LEGGGRQPFSFILFCYIVSLADSCPLLLSCYIFSPPQSQSPSAILNLSHGPNDTKLRYQTTVSSNPDIHFTKAVQPPKDLMPPAAEPYPFYAATAQRIDGHRFVLQQNFSPHVALDRLVGWLVPQRGRSIL